METKIENYNKYDVKEGDVYAWNNSEGDILAEVVNDKNYGLVMTHKGNCKYCRERSKK